MEYAVLWQNLTFDRIAAKSLMAKITNFAIIAERLWNNRLKYLVFRSKIFLVDKRKEKLYKGSRHLGVVLFEGGTATLK